MSIDKKKSSGKMILLIEGNERERTNLSSRLRMLNFSIESPLDGFHTLHLCERNNYDVILITSDMEDMPGIEIASLIRTQKKTDSIPIIYVSPKGENPSADFLMENGITECIFQPFNFNNIVERLSKLL